jgi:acetoacetyl-CoA synthetase
VLHFEDGGGMGKLVLIVDADEDADTTALEKTIRTALRTELSPRHVPDHIVFVESIPRNPNGKRLEIPLKRIIQGAVLGEVLDPGAVIRAEDIDETVRRVNRALQPS